MALTREQSQIWQAMNVGVQWVLRDGIDPLAPEPKPAASAAPAEVKPSSVSPSATIPAGSAPAAPAMVRRGPMATRLRRQQAAAGIQSAPAATTANPAASAAVVQNLKPAAAASIATRPALRPVAPPRPQSAAALRCRPTLSSLPNFAPHAGKTSRELPIAAASARWRLSAPTLWWPTAHRAAPS